MKKMAMYLVLIVLGVGVCASGWMNSVYLQDQLDKAATTIILPTIEVGPGTTPAASATPAPTVLSSA